MSKKNKITAYLKKFNYKLVKEYPINLKARWSTFGIVYNINLGWKFSIN